MPNPVKGEVVLDLGEAGRFTLVFDMNALIEAEEAYSKPMGETVAAANKGFVGATRALLFGAMQRHHPEMSLLAVGELLTLHGDAIGIALGGALEKAMPKAEGREPGNAPPRRAGNRSKSNGTKPG